MSNNNFSTAIEDEHQIASLLIRWGHARDSDDWEILSGCFHDDATIHISWITGPAQDFIARSRTMAAARKPGDHTKHLISAPGSGSVETAHSAGATRTFISAQPWTATSLIYSRGFVFSICGKGGTTSGESSSAPLSMKKTVWSQSIRAAFRKTSSTIWSCPRFQHQPSFCAIASCAVVVRLRPTLSPPTVTRSVH